MNLCPEKSTSSHDDEILKKKKKEREREFGAKDISNHPLVLHQIEKQTSDLAWVGRVNPGSANFG